MDGSIVSSLSFPSLIYINQFSLGCYYNGNDTYLSTITSLNFPSLQTLGGVFSLNSIFSLTSLTFPVLQNLSGSIYFNSYSGMGGGSSYNNFTTISFPALTSCNSINDNNNTYGASGNINLPFTMNPFSINLSSLTSCNSINLDYAYLTNLNLPNLTSCQFLSVHGITNFTPPTNLTSCNSLSIRSMPNLTSLSFPSLSSCDLINISSNPLLNSITFPALTNSSNFNLGNNALPTTNINSLLHDMLTVSPTISKNIDLSSQTPLAPPTGQGLIDKQTLINAGNSVGTD